MKTLAAKEAKAGFGRLLDAAARGPVAIEKKGRPVAVVLSVEEYKRLEALENTWWAARADAAVEQGFLGTKAGEKLIRELLDAAD